MTWLPSSAKERWLGLGVDLGGGRVLRSCFRALAREGGEGQLFWLKLRLKKQGYLESGGGYESRTKNLQLELHQREEISCGGGKRMRSLLSAGDENGAGRS